ncbi:MAG TPA: right-handed parallel beta-helix repeat-containing protein [Bryobacteraceae bacterium]|nr:right-handed parallel beta-helix repeat-containing protein [Bryobacteraceae bacterium]
MFRVSLLTVCVAAFGSVVSAATCTPTGFIRDNINMTAVLINPSGTVSGDIDATGCNIGIYYDHGKGQVKNASVHDANYFGIAVNGDLASVSVDVINTNVHDIGEKPFDGTQHGVGIYYRAFGVGSTSSKITGNTVARYQKGGIVVNGNSDSNISDNIVTGLGRVDFIAGNGIQVGYGASAQVMRNTVTGNAYTGANGASSGGILVFGGDCYGGAFTTGTQIVGNTLVNNDVGAYLSNLDTSCLAPLTATNIKVVNNTITNDALSNISGDGGTQGYQAGVSDVGNNDKIINNNISGLGYSTVNTPTMYAIDIDASTTFTNRPKVHANK